MANYDVITGNIEEIFEGETRNGKPYVGIKFECNTPHEGQTYPEIKWFFPSGATEGNKKAVEISQEKVERLLSMAGLPAPKQKPKSVKQAVALLTKEELVYLEIPITIQQNTWEGKTKAQYDLGWAGDGDPLGRVSSGFDKFADLLAEKKAEAKAARDKSVVSSPNTPTISVYDDDGIPF